MSEENLVECSECGDIYEEGSECAVCAAMELTKEEAPTVVTKVEEVPPVVPKAEASIPPSEKILYGYLNEYQECTVDPTPKNLKRSINIFIKICTHLIKEKNVGLYRIVYNKVFKTPGKVLAPEVVFAYLHENMSSEKQKYTTLYTTMSYIADYQRSGGGKRGMTLDMNRITENYGCESLTTFVKSFIR